MEPEWNIPYNEHDALKLGLNNTSPLTSLIEEYGLQQILRWLADHIDDAR